MVQLCTADEFEPVLDRAALLKPHWLFSFKWSSNESFSLCHANVEILNR